MTVDLAPGSLPALCALAEAEARRHPLRTPERRAAAHLRTALVTSATVDGAQRAIGSFGAARVQADARHLFHRLAARLAETTATEGTT